MASVLLPLRRSLRGVGVALRCMFASLGKVMTRVNTYLRRVGGRVLGPVLCNRGLSNFLLTLASEGMALRCGACSPPSE